MGDIQRGMGDTIHLAEKETKLIISVYPRRLGRDLWKYRYFYGTGAALILLVLAVNHFARLEAATADFHPASCLGGWRNPALAENKPDATSDTLEAFTDLNSAVLIGGSASELYCGSFAGEIPEGTQPTRLLVKLSWTLKEAAEAPAILATSTLVETNSTSTATSTDSTSSPQAATSTEPEATSTPPEATTTTETTTAPESASEPAQTAPEPIPTPAPEPPSEPTPPPAPEPSSSVIPAPFDSTQGEQAGLPGQGIQKTLSFRALRGILSVSKKILRLAQDDKRVFAAEENPATDTNGELDVSTTTATTTDSNASSTSTATSSLAVISDDFLEIVYTLDGVDWKNLGRVNHADWQSLTLEIPVAEIQNWEDISKIQIGFRSLSSTGETPAVYLDAITLSAEYENLPAPSADTTSTSTDSTSSPQAATSTPTTTDIFASSSLIDNLKNLATSTEPQNSVTYSRSPSGVVVTSPVTVNFSFADWVQDMDFVDIFGKRQDYWWIEVDSKDKYYLSSCYSSSTTSATHTFNIPSGDYYSVIVNAANSLGNCQAGYGGQTPPGKRAFGEPGDGGNTKTFTVQ